MSKKSKKNQLDNQLEDLFDDLEQDADLKSLSTEKTTLGWVWEINGQKLYTDCSQEIKDILGYQPQVLLGQPILDFAIAESSRKELEQAFEQSEYPAQVEVIFISTRGEHITVSLNILAKSDPTGEIIGWHGFAEQLSPPRDVQTYELPALKPVYTGTLSPEDLAYFEQQEKREAAQAKEEDTGTLPEPDEVITEPVAEEEPAPEAPAAEAAPAEEKPSTVTLPDLADEETQPEPEEEPALETPVADAPSAAEEPSTITLPDLADEEIQPEPEEELAPEAPVADAPSTADEPSTITLPDLADEETQPEPKEEPEPAAAPRTAVEIVPAQAPSDIQALLDQMEDVSEPEKTRPLARPGIVTQADKKISVIKTPIQLPQDSQALIEIMDDDSERTWTEDEILLVEQVADQLSLALENAELFQQTQSALAETDMLYQASAELNAANTFEDIITTMHRHSIAGEASVLTAINIFDAPWETGRPPEWIQVVQRTTNLSQSRLRTMHRFADMPAVTRLLNKFEPAIVEDIETIPTLQEEISHSISSPTEAKSLIFLPITVGGIWYGFFDIYYPTPIKFSEAEFRRLTSLAIQASEKTITLQLNRSEEIRRRNSDRLSNIARQIAEIVSQEELVSMTINLLYDFINPDQLSIYEWQPERIRFTLSQRTLNVPDHAEDEYIIGDLINPEDRMDLSAVFENNTPHYQVNNLSPEIIQEHYMLPWIVGDQSEGVVEIYKAGRDPEITETDQEFVQGLLLQIASAMERAKLFEQTQVALALTDKQAHRLRLLNELSEELGQVITLQEAYDLTVQKTHQIFPSDRVSMALLTSDRQNIEISAALESEGNLAPGTVFPLEGSANQTAIEENRIIITPETPSTNLGDIRSFMIGPLSVSGEVIGTLNVGSIIPNTYAEGDEDFLSQLLATIGSVVENRQLFLAIQDALSDSEEQARRLSLLNEMSDFLTQSTLPSQIYQIAVTYTQKIVNADRASLTMTTLEPDKMEIMAVSGDLQSGQAGHRVDIAGSLKTVVEENRIVSNLELETEDGSHQSTMVAPITFGSEVAGTINIMREGRSALSERDQTIMLQISSLVSGILQNNRLFAQIQHRSVQLETGAEVSQVASTLLDTDELISRVVDLIKDGFDLYYCGLFLIDEDGDWTGEPNKWAVLRAGTGEAGQQMLDAEHKLEIGGTSMIGTAISNSEARIALDVGEEAIFFRNPYLPDTRSEMAVPLTARNIVLGALSIQSDREAAFTEEDITSLRTMGDQLANAIENARLFEQTEARAEELAVLNEMARSFTQTLDVDTIIENTYNFTSRLMDGDNFYLATFDSDQEMIEFKMFVEDGTRIPAPVPQLKLGEGLTDWIITNAMPALMPEDVKGHHAEMGLEVRDKLPESYLGVPLLIGTQVIGVIAVQSYTTPRAYGSHELDLLSAVANQAAIAIDNASRFQEARSRARREQALREITARVHSSADAETILRTAAREISSALGRQTFVTLGDPDTVKKEQPPIQQPNKTNGNTDTNIMPAPPLPDTNEPQEEEE